MFSNVQMCVWTQPIDGTTLSCLQLPISSFQHIVSTVAICFDVTFDKINLHTCKLANTLSCVSIFFCQVTMHYGKAVMGGVTFRSAFVLKMRPS